MIRGWIAAGRIAEVDPHHLIFSIWALTQHYADFDVQVRAVLGDADPLTGAERYFGRALHPSAATIAASDRVAWRQITDLLKAHVKVRLRVLGDPVSARRNLTIGL